MTSAHGGTNNEAISGTAGEVAALLEGLLPGEGDLLEGLHRIQERFGYLPRETIPAAARQLRLPEARVFGAITFYSEFRLTPPPETLVSWCSGAACYIKGGANVRLVLENLLGCQMGESTPDNQVGLHLGQCNGTCDTAPQVWVNGKIVGPLDASKTVELVRDLKEGKLP